MTSRMAALRFYYMQVVAWGGRPPLRGEKKFVSEVAAEIPMANFCGPTTRECSAAYKLGGCLGGQAAT